MWITENPLDQIGKTLGGALGLDKYQSLSNLWKHYNFFLQRSKSI
jgi:hypothetical protein